MPRNATWLVVAILAAGAVAAAAALGTWGWWALNTPLTIPAGGMRVEVATGTPLRRVTAELAEQAVLGRPWLLALYARLTGEATRIRAGEYELVPGTTARGLLAQLVAGQVVLHQLTIIEGSRFADLLAAVRAHPAVLAGRLNDTEIMTALGAPGVHPEGQFFPDTYFFPRGTSDIELLRQARTALTEHLAGAWQQRRTDTLLASEYEALILASIIEKETGLASERRLISGVFHERLRRRMRLQTDPTVIYGLGDTFDGNLRRQDLERDTPYNTYTRSGLPPTPIALPGTAALEAAVLPEITGAIYFVATGRGDGGHRFSATLAEHQRAVRDYLRASRSREP